MINFEDKENTKVNNLPRKNTWTALDMNEIKSVVNALAFTRVNVSGVGVVPNLQMGQLGLNTTDGVLYLLTPSGMMSLHLWLYNFWVFADWTALGVTNQATFIAWVEANSGYTVDSVSDFNLVGTELKCNIAASGDSSLIFESQGITEVKAIGNGFDGLKDIVLTNNSLTTFNLILPLPSGLLALNLQNNNISNWGLSLPWINAQPAFTDPCTILTSGNPTSAVGTAFETAANLKNATIVE